VGQQGHQCHLSKWLRGVDISPHPCYSTFVPEVLMNTNDIISVREQIQEDLICLLATQFDDEGQMDEVQRIACQIVVDNFTQLLK